MQLAIGEDRRVQEPDEGLEIKARAGSVKCGSDDWARQFHQWQSRINQGSTQVNSTGVYQAMYWAFIYCTRARTDQAMLPLSSNGKRGAGQRVASDEWQKVRLSRVQSRNEKKRSPTQPLGQRAMTS